MEVTPHDSSGRVDRNRLPEHDEGCLLSFVVPRSRPCHCRTCPAGEKFVQRHLCVTLAWLVRHSVWDTLALPLRALLYVRAKDVPTLAQSYPWAFRTKLALAVDLVRWLSVWLGGLGKKLWLAVDGAYAKRPFLRPVLELGVVVFSRLRKDANLRDVPSRQRRRGQRGPLPTYGK